MADNEMKRDAERYRFLREAGVCIPTLAPIRPYTPRKGEELDKAIDAHLK